MDPDIYKPKVATALQALEHTLERLVDALAHRPLWIQIDGTGSERDAIRRACAAYSTIDYAMDDEANRSPVCLGVIGVSAEVLARAAQVNEMKAALKTVCAPLQRISTRIPVKGEGGPTRSVPVIRAILRTLQRSDLNLLAAYRKIPVLGAPPASVTYTRARTRAVYRKTVEEVATLLMTMDGPSAGHDRAMIASLSPSELHLAFVKEHYTNIRANIVYDRLDARGRGRVQVVAELPLLYANGRHPNPPEVHFPATEPDPNGRTARRARQSKLEPNPYLQSLPVYRYAPSH